MCCPWFPPYSNRDMFTIVACHVVNGVVYYTVRYKNGQYQIFPEYTVLIYAPDEVMRYHFNNGSGGLSIEKERLISNICKGNCRDIYFLWDSETLLVK